MPSVGKEIEGMCKRVENHSYNEFMCLQLSFYCHNLYLIRERVVKRPPSDPCFFFAHQKAVQSLCSRSQSDSGPSLVGQVGNRVLPGAISTILFSSSSSLFAHL